MEGSLISVSFLCVLIQNKLFIFNKNWISIGSITWCSFLSRIVYTVSQSNPCFYIYIIFQPFWRSWNKTYVFIARIRTDHPPWTSWAGNAHPFPEHLIPPLSCIHGIGPCCHSQPIVPFLRSCFDPNGFLFWLLSFISWRFFSK